MKCKKRVKVKQSSELCNKKVRVQSMLLKKDHSKLKWLMDFASINELRWLDEWVSKIKRSETKKQEGMIEREEWEWEKRKADSETQSEKEREREWEKEKRGGRVWSELCVDKLWKDGWNKGCSHLLDYADVCLINIMQVQVRVGYTKKG